MTKHSLKINPVYFDAVKNGIKTFEIRKNDRDYRVGDTISLGEWVPGTIEAGSWTGRRVKVAITYILTHDDFSDGISEGYVILGIKVIPQIMTDNVI